jgi:D-alanyl-D-alanine carboxypeptidase
LIKVFIIIGMLVSTFPNGPVKTRLENELAQKVVPAEQAVPKINLEIKKVPEQKVDIAQISSSSKGALFVDFDSGETLFEKNKDAKLPMASTTKLMTALVALDKLDINQTITIPNYQLRPLDSTVGLIPGSKVKLSELLHGLLIESGADAALTISNELGGEHQFVALMNEKAVLLGLKNTQFTNSVGYDDEGHYSTAQDLIKLGRISLTSLTIADIVQKPKYTLTDEAGRKYYLANTNKLLSDKNIKGLKTGTTFEAGECLITLYNDGERKILGVVLNSPDRFYETQTILQWTKQAFSW